MAGEKTIALLFTDAEDADRTVTWPCKVSVPQDGGKTEVQEFDAAFTIPTPGELEDYQTQQTLLGVRKDVALLEKHLKGFPGQGVTFDKAKELAFKRPYIVDGLVAGLISMSRGRAAKN